MRANHSGFVARLRAAALLSLVFMAACDRGSRVAVAPARKTQTANGATSPAQEKHPGEIGIDDKVEGRVRTERASAVPQSIAWSNLDGKWIPVVRIEITGTSDRREMASYGPGGRFLERTVQSPPQPRSAQ